MLQVPLLLLLLLLAGSWPLYHLRPLLSDETITVEGDCVHRIGLLSGVWSGAGALAEDEFIWGEPEQKFGLLVSYTSSGKNLPEPLPNITDWCAAPPVQHHQCSTSA